MHSGNKWRLAGISLILTFIAALGMEMCAEAQSYWWPRGTFMSKPPLVRFTGTFLPLEQEGEVAQPAHVLEVVVGEERNWIFVVEEARNLSSSETKLGILRDISPPKLYFRGLAEPLKFLQNPEIAGERVSILGYLYMSSRRFYLTRAEKVKAKKETN